MRKMIAVLTSVLMIFTLAACGRNESKQSMPEDMDISGVDAAESLNLKVESDMPDSQSDTVANATADPRNQQTLYLWERGNAPATTEYTQNNGNYADDPDFRPYIVTFPVPEGTGEGILWYTEHWEKT